MKYFNNVNTLEKLRAQYKELLKKYHPDNPNGSTEATQAINAEYTDLFKDLKNKHERTAEKADKTSYNDMKYDFEEDEHLRDTLQSIIHLSDIVIEVCGSWIWVSGSTYQHRTKLKDCGFKYASKKKQWYWHSEAFRKRGKKTLSMDDIRSYYGSTEVKTDEVKRLKQA